MSNYGTAIDKKWQKKWEETELYKFDPNNEGEKLYVLEMFSQEVNYMQVTGLTTVQLIHGQD